MIPRTDLLTDPPRPRTNEAYLFASVDLVRREILQIAKHRFARYGYEGTTLHDVARVTNLSAAELRIHFNDKLSLLMAVLDEGWAGINDRLQEIIISSKDARQAALSTLAIMMRVVEKDEDFARLILFEGRCPDPEYGQIMLSQGFRRFMRHFTKLVERGQKDGSFNPYYPSRIIVSILFGAVENLMRDRIMTFQEGYMPYTGAQLITVFDALVSYLEPQAAA